MAPTSYFLYSARLSGGVGERIGGPAGTPPGPRPPAIARNHGAKCTTPPLDHRAIR